MLLACQTNTNMKGSSSLQPVIVIIAIRSFFFLVYGSGVGETALGMAPLVDVLYQ